MTDTIAGILLAAGRGTRMGRPKALLRWGRETFVERAIRTWATVCDPVVVVAGARFEEVATLVRSATAASSAVFNPSFDAGMFTSVQAGLGAVPAGRGAALIGSIDQPLLDARLLEALVAARKDAPDAALVPEFRGQPGHPVLIPAGLFPALAAEPEWSSLRRFLARIGEERPEQVRRIPLELPEIVRNVNTPEAYRDFMKEALVADQGGAPS